MSYPQTIKTTVAILMLPALVLSVANANLNEQVLSEVIASGKAFGEATANRAVRPDVSNKFPDSLPDPVRYTDLITLPPASNLRAIEFSSTGIIALDGNWLRRFNAAGVEQSGPLFPVDCTSIDFLVPKGQGMVLDQFKTCTTFTALPDGSSRIFGATNGKSLVVVKYGPDPGPGQLAVDGAPPQVSEAVADVSEKALTRFGEAYLAIAEKKKAIAFPLNDEQAFVNFATFNGKTLTGLAPFGDGRVVIADNKGVLYNVIKDVTGTWSTETFLQLGPLCEPDGRKTVQNFRLQSDGNEDLLYVTDQACGTVTAYQSDGTPVVLYTDEQSNDVTTLVLDNDPNAGIAENGADFFPNDIDVQIGQIGDFGDCEEGSPGICEYGQVVGEAQQFDTILLEDPNDPNSTYRAFKFVLQDCRHSETKPGPNGERCPIENCIEWNGDETACVDPEDKSEQELNIIQLALFADPSNQFRATLPDPDNPPVVALQGYLNAQKDIPVVPPPNIDNEHTFYWYYLDTQAVTSRTFTNRYDLDVIRGVGTDECTNVGPDSVAVVNERTNVIAYTPDFYDTVFCDFDDPNATNACGVGKKAIVINSRCENPSESAGFRWSGQLVGLEFTEEELDTFLKFTELQQVELQKFKDNILCNDALVLPDGLSGGVDRLGNDDAFLSQSSCDNMQNELDQIDQKLETCHDSAREVQGNSAENCNALFTKIDNLESMIDDPFRVAWPAPVNPAAPTVEELRILRPNFEGEFRARILAFEFALTDWFFPPIPEGGIGP